MKRSWPYLLAGSAVFIVVLGALKAYTTNRYAVADFEFGIALFYNLTSWFWSLALIGLFLRFMQSQNRVLRYVSDSSYWVFLVHMLGTIGFSVAMLNLPTGPVAKMALNIVATSAVCLVTYQLLVRHTLIGVLLNGRRHVKGNRATPADAVVIGR